MTAMFARPQANDSFALFVVYDDVAYRVATLEPRNDTFVLDSGDPDLDAQVNLTTALMADTSLGACLKVFRQAYESLWAEREAEHAAERAAENAWLRQAESCDEAQEDLALHDDLCALGY